MMFKPTSNRFLNWSKLNQQKWKFYVTLRKNDNSAGKPRSSECQWKLCKGKRINNTIDVTKKSGKNMFDKDQLNYRSCEVWRKTFELE